MRARERRKRLYSIILIPRVLKIRRYLKKYIRKEEGNVSVIVLTEHIGDIIACEPVSYWLKRTYQHKVVWLINEKYHELLLMFRNVDEIIDLSCLSEWVYLDKFTHLPHVYNLHFDGRQCSRFYLSNQSSQKHIGFENYYNYGCLLESFCMVGKLPRLNIRPQLFLVQHTLSFNYLLPDKYIVVHPQANDISRNWDIGKWNQLISSFPDFTFIEIGLSPVLSGKNCITSLCGKLTFQDIALVVKNCFLFIGIDSGMAHFANALGTPSLILLGKYGNFDKYMPYSGIFDIEDFRVIQYPDFVYDLPVSIVKEEADRFISALNAR